MALTLDDYAAAPERGRAMDIVPDDGEIAAMDGALPFEEAPPHDDKDAPLPFA